MAWTFAITEVSAGSYRCDGKRDSGHVVAVHGGEGEFSKVFRFAFELECELGTDPCPALFVVIRGAKPDWEAAYYSQSFGSWEVRAPAPHSGRITFDGRDSCLSVHGSGDQLQWEGTFRHREDVPDEVFGFLSMSVD